MLKTAGTLQSFCKLKANKRILFVLLWFFMFALPLFAMLSRDFLIKQSQAADSTEVLARPPAEYFERPKLLPTKSDSDKDVRVKINSSAPFLQKMPQAVDEIDDEQSRLNRASLDRPPPHLNGISDHKVSSIPSSTQPASAHQKRVEKARIIAAPATPPSKQSSAIPKKLLQTLRIKGFSTNPNYGYTSEAPMLLGPAPFDSEVDDKAARLAALELLLVTDRGADLSLEFVRECCPYQDQKDLRKKKLSIYRVRPAKQRSFLLFIDHYRHGPLLAPLGLGYHPSLTARRDYAKAIIPFSEGRLQAAFDALAPLAAAGHPLALYYRASAAAGLERKSQVVSFYQAAAETGLAPAQFLTGVALAANRRPGSTLSSEALEWIIKAAKGGHADARAWLGFARLSGAEGIPINLERGLFWLRLAAEQGQVAAQHDLGLVMIESTKQAPQVASSEQNNQKIMEGVIWLLIAHQDGHPSAGEELQKIILKMGSETLTQAREQAAIWRKKERPSEIVLQTSDAAMAGDVNAMARFARFLFNGVLMTRDVPASLFYFHLAAKAGHIESAALIPEIESLLPKEIVAEIVEQATAWKPSSEIK